MSYQATLTVPAASLTAALSNFPVRVDLAHMPTGWWADVAAAGADIRVRQSGTDLAFDLVRIDTTAHTGELFFKAPALSNAVANVFTVEVVDGATAPAVTDTIGRNAVWVDYDAVLMGSTVNRTGGVAAVGVQGSVPLIYAVDRGPQVVAHQGVAVDDAGNFYLIDTDEIIKYSPTWVELARATTPVADTGVAAVNHISDGTVFNGELYCPFQTWPTTTPVKEYIGVWDLATLAFKRSYDVSANGHAVAGICRNTANNRWYLVDYNDAGDTLIHEYDASFTRLGALTTAAITNKQSIEYFDGFFWIASGDTENLYRVNTDGTGATIAADCHLAIGATTATELEGLAARGDQLYVHHVSDDVSNTAYVHTFEYPRGRTLLDGRGWYRITGVPKRTTWTMGATGYVARPLENNTALLSYNVNSSTNTNAAVLNLDFNASVGGDRYGIWNSTDSWLHDTAVNGGAGDRYRLHHTQSTTVNRKLWRDGVLRATDAGVSQRPLSSGDTLFVGNSTTTAAEAFVGALSRVYLRNGELSAAWLAAEYASWETPASFYSVTAGPIVVSGEAAVASAVALDGSPVTPIRVAGEAAVATATALDGTPVVPVSEPIVVAGEAAAATAIALDGQPSGVTITGESAVATAVALDGAITGAPIVIAGDPAVATAVALDGTMRLVFGTDRRDLSASSRRRTGEAFVDIRIPVTPEPPTVTAQAIPVVVDRLPDPVVSGGVVQPLTPDTLREDTWGRVRIRVEHTDVTFFRDVPAQVVDWQLTDPYGHGPATLKFPQISFYELGDFGTGPLHWLAKNADVDIDHVKAGEYQETIWSGHIDAFDFDESGALVCDCAGELMGRMDKTHRTQRLVRRVHDAGFLARIAVAIPNKHYHTPGMGAWDGRVGIDLENTGGGMDTNLVFLDYVLTQSVDEALQSWTILPVEGKRRHYDLVPRDQTTVDFTVYLGARGVGAQLRDDQTEQPNRLFGEGVDPGGWRYRNAVYPNLSPEVVPPYPFNDNRTFGADGMADEDTDTGAGITVLENELVGSGLLSLGSANNLWGPATTEAVEETQRRADLPVTGRVDPATWTAVFGDGIGQQRLTQGHIEPLVWAPATEMHRLSPNGSITGRNPAYDKDVPRIERWVSFGEGVSKRRARRWLRREHNRLNTKNWRGTLNLTSDVMAGEHTYGTHGTPMSRMDIRPGMNVMVKRFGSAAGMLMHVSAVSGSGLDGDTPSVQLAVDTQFRDYITLAEMLERDKAARLDPARQWRNQHRRSTTPSDAIIGWDREAGAGFVRPTRLDGGTWNVIPVVAGQSGEIQRVDLATSNDPAEFIMAIFALPIRGGTLNKRIGNPFSVGSGDENIFSKQEVADWLAGRKKENRDELRARIEAQEQAWDESIADGVAKREKRIAEQMDALQDKRIGVYVAGTTEQPCGFWPHVKTNSNGERTEFDVTGAWRDDAGFSFWTLGPANPLLYLAVFPDRDCTIGGQMYDQLSEGV